MSGWMVFEVLPGTYEIRSAGGRRVVAECEGRDDAALIVAAVNEREVLREALSDCLHHCMLDWTWDDPRAIAARKLLDASRNPTSPPGERHG